MRIGFDARPLVGPRTGVGVWLAGLLGELAARTPWTFVGFLPRPAAVGPLPLPAPRLEVRSSPLPLPGTLWLHTLAAAQVGGAVDVFLGTLTVLPRRLGVPAVAVVHDLTPRTRPHRHTLANRLCFNAYLEASVTEAAAVVCDSAATRARLAEVLPGPARRAEVIPPGVEAFWFQSPPWDAAATRERFAGGKPYVVQLGTLEPRKGLETLIAAHALLLQRDPSAPDLVLAGARGWGGRWLERALQRHPAPARVHLPGYVRRQEAHALLAHAEAVVVAAEEEGFGLPLAEALACGAACVASDAPALLEVAAGAARHFPRGEAAALAAALAEVLQPPRREALRARARARARHLRWEGPAAAWSGLLRTLVAGERGP